MTEFLGELTLQIKIMDWRSQRLLFWSCNIY